MMLLHVLACFALLLLAKQVYPDERFERQAPAYPVWLLGEDVRYNGNYVQWFTGCDTTNVVAITEVSSIARYCCYIGCTVYLYCWNCMQNVFDP